MICKLSIGVGTQSLPADRCAAAAEAAQASGAMAAAPTVYPDYPDDSSGPGDEPPARGAVKVGQVLHQPAVPSWAGLTVRLMREAC